ncbi:MAG TPA: CBS domain-containing protein [Solirubrobacteraceae bacterium]|nr:CBS domain-containing protein [Solirubrobacteraceae bacterium]
MAPAPSSAPIGARPAAAARTVGEVMRPGIVTCARASTAADIARIMREGRTDCLVILSNGHGLDQFPVVWGLVTGDDLGRPLAEVDPMATAEELAHTPVVRARVDLTIPEARSLCSAVGVSHLLVIDSAHGTPLGVISAAELASHGDAPNHERKDASCTATS